jgi:hypothetical protein
MAAIASAFARAADPQALAVELVQRWRAVAV